jgi:hypothetical protein
MDSGKPLLILLALACIAMFIAGCTTTTTIGNPATSPAATAAAGAPARAPVAAVATTVVAAAPAAPVVQTTPECPDKYEKGVWDYSWDTRWNGYENGDTIIDLASGKDDWNGINAPGATAFKMSQKCWDVTGTISFATDPVCTGSITATIDKNHPYLLTGVWKTTGCQPEDEGAEGTISVTMAADNKTWIGKLISSNDPYKNHDDNPPNWAARMV